MTGGSIPEVSFETPAPEPVRRAVLEGLSDAPALLADALHVKAPRRPYQRVEIALVAGAGTHGEALPLGEGCIRLIIGAEATPDEARRIARHEALHLLLAAALRGGERWNDPAVAFPDWIVRGIESGMSAPRFHAPLPGIVTRLPRSRTEVEKKLSSPSAGYFGSALAQAIAGEPREQQKLWLVEAALGVHHLEAAARLGEGAIRAAILDDWLLDYEQYARAVGSAPSDAGRLWRLSDPGWSRDPLVRLSAAAQALQRDDRCWFADKPFADDVWVWKNRGRVRLPLTRAPTDSRPLPIHGFRAALSGLDAALLEDASRGEARQFEARALWPRVLARLLASGARPPDVDPESVPFVQTHDDESFRIWSEAAAALPADFAPWTPRVVAPREVLPEGPMLLVYGGPPAEESVTASRRLAAVQPVRGAVFRGHLDQGRIWERLPDFDEPLDPRYRDDAWQPGPTALASIDEATREGRLSTPLAHLLSMMAPGVEECLYAQAQR